jgi:hypothetical protein
MKTTLYFLGAALAFAAALMTSGCLAINPADGALQCSTVGKQCPSGFHCAVDNTCWHDGKDPVVGGGGDMANVVVSGDMAGTPTNSSCMQPQDCLAASSPCQVQACIHSECALVAVVGGTVVSPSQQVPGDCTKLVCNDTGNAVPMPDPTDVPPDPTGGCQTPACNGMTPTFTPTASGTVCTGGGGGVCNGAGVCGACKPGGSRCSNLTVQSCSTAGQWVDGATCKNACTNGACTGSCTVGVDASYCSGIDQLNACGADHNWHASTCPNACVNGACGGTCKPSGKTCSGNNVTWCDSNGNPQSQSCSSCLNGACVDCTPSTSTCCTTGGVAGAQTCDSTGHWGACNSCGGAAYSCSGAGSCACTMAPSPCHSGDTCGTRPDACGVTQACGGGDGTCPQGETCRLVLGNYVCKPIVTTTATTRGPCPCGDSCCGKLCC